MFAVLVVAGLVVCIVGFNQQNEGAAILGVVLAMAAFTMGLREVTGKK